jgi:hypothetical protein
MMHLKILTSAGVMSRSRSLVVSAARPGPGPAVRKTEVPTKVRAEPRLRLNALFIVSVLWYNKFNHRAAAAAGLREGPTTEHARRRPAHVTVPVAGPGGPGGRGPAAERRRGSLATEPPFESAEAPRRAAPVPAAGAEVPGRVCSPRPEAECCGRGWPGRAGAVESPGPQ